jgi:hypothetical protein
MTGINASKIIQNLQILNSFAVPISSASAALVLGHRGNRERCRGNLISLAGFFSFFQIGSGAYPYHPRPREGRLPIGVSACPQLGPGFQQWDPESGDGTPSLESFLGLGPYWIERFNWHDLNGPQFDNQAIPIGAIGTRNSNSGNWPIGNSIQFNSPNSMTAIQLDWPRKPN